MDEMSFEQRLMAEGGREFWKEEEVNDLTSVMKEGMSIWRANNWPETVQLVASARKDGRL